MRGFSQSCVIDASATRPCAHRLRFLSLLACAAICLTGVLAGCASRGPNIPSSAMIAASGNGDLSARAAHDGHVYVYDQTAQKLLYSGPVLKGDLIHVDVDNHRILKNDRVISETVISNEDTNKIYFDPSAEPVAP